MRIIFVLVAIMVSGGADAGDVFQARSSPMLPPMAAIADVIAVGELRAEIGETDRNGASEIRFLLMDARFILEETTAISDPFAAQPSDVVFTAQIREEPGTRSLDQSLFRILEGKSVIVFLRRRDSALECVDAWFSIHPYNPRLEEEIKRANEN